MEVTICGECGNGRPAVFCEVYCRHCEPGELMICDCPHYKSGSHVVKLHDIPEDAVVSVTAEALRDLYYQGFGAGNWDDVDDEPDIEVLRMEQRPGLSAGQGR